MVDPAPVRDPLAASPPAPPPRLDPDVELLPDVPIIGPDEDVLGRGPVALRLTELACAQPAATPRVIGLCGGGGAGKSSVLNLAAALLGDRGDAVLFKLDAAAHGTPESLMAELTQSLQEYFSAAGVVDASDAARDALTRYGGIVSSVAKLAGVKVDLAGAVKRSAESVRAEIAEMTQEVGKRLVIAIDHIDRFASRELAAALEALRHYAAIPYVAVVLAYDRRAAGERVARGELDAAGFERFAQVELALPPTDRVLLARLLAGGLARVASRLGRDLDPILPLVDPDASDGGLVLQLCETARDAKRAINALSAAIPLWPDGGVERSEATGGGDPAGSAGGAGGDAPRGFDVRDAALDLVLRLLVPVLDGARLDARTTGDDATRAALLAELSTTIAGHRRSGAARAALRALILRLGPADLAQDERGS